MARRSHIILLRQPCELDPYVAAFEARGFAARCIPALRAEFVNEEALAARLTRPDTYGGLVFTSPRAVEALGGRDLAPWRAKPAFAVGPATAAAARALGLRPEGAAAGDAETLAGLITAQFFAQPLLFLCGDRRRDGLPDRLRVAAVPFDECVVYRTLITPPVFGGAALDLPDWVAFFSPSGVEAALAAPGFPWNSVSCASIGPTTADALCAAGHPPDAIAARPTPNHLATAVAQAVHA